MALGALGFCLRIVSLRHVHALAIRVRIKNRCAVEQVRVCQPDVILMDIHMPRMNGIQAASAIKGSSQEVTIIGLCGVQHLQATNECLQAGALAVVLKDRVEDLHSTRLL